MAKSIEFNQIGGPEVLEVKEKKISTPNKNEVLVKVKAAGLNQAELLYFMGHYVFQPSFPSKVGLEASGEIVQIGRNVKGFVVGDEVCLTPNIMPYEYGFMGEYVIAPIESLVKKPKELSFEQAAAFWMTYATSYAGLVLKGGLERGKNQTVLISAASSGVGIAAIQLAKNYGANVIATTRSKEKESFLVEQGADLVVNTTNADLTKSIEMFTNVNGYHIAFDAIGGGFWNQLAESAAQEAIIVNYGALALDFESPFPAFPTLVKGLTFTGVHLVFHLLQHKERFDSAKSELLEGLENGQYRPVIDKIFKLEEIQDAYEYMMRGKQMGKIIIKP